MVRRAQGAMGLDLVYFHLQLAEMSVVFWVPYNYTVLEDTDHT